MEGSDNFKAKLSFLLNYPLNSIDRTNCDAVLSVNDRWKKSISDSH